MEAKRVLHLWCMQDPSVAPLYIQQDQKAVFFCFLIIGTERKADLLIGIESFGEHTQEHRNLEVDIVDDQDLFLVCLYPAYPADILDHVSFPGYGAARMRVSRRGKSNPSPMYLPVARMRAGTRTLSIVSRYSSTSRFTFAF